MSVACLLVGLRFLDPIFGIVVANFAAVFLAIGAAYLMDGTALEERGRRHLALAVFALAVVGLFL
ncbi:MAG: hypothetical protein HKP30_12945 [Myxococcales bacterium]|nr:hypothetical protein [Myxococcales bacterium]